MKGHRPRSPASSTSCSKFDQRRCSKDSPAPSQAAAEPSDPDEAGHHHSVHGRPAHRLLHGLQRVLLCRQVLCARVVVHCSRALCSRADWDQSERLTWSGVIAVIAVNLVLVGWGIYAYLIEADDHSDLPEVDGFGRPLPPPQPQQQQPADTSAGSGQQAAAAATAKGSAPSKRAGSNAGAGVGAKAAATGGGVGAGASAGAGKKKQKQKSQ